VVGGGIFGATAAVELAGAGFEVDLYERLPDLLFGASRCNQGRLHSGYHYPRSDETAGLARAAAPKFAARFPDAVTRVNQHYYCISREASLTNGDDFLDFCQRLELPYREQAPDLVCGDTVEVTIRVPEALIDIQVLRETLREELRRAHVHLHLGVEAGPHILEPYEWTVVAAYGGVNQQVTPRPTAVRPLRFEVCEVALMELGPEFARHSFVVMDGPFVSLDPAPGGELFHLYDVRHSVHAVTVGLEPEVPMELIPMIDRGPIRCPGLSTHELMLETARRYLPRLAGARYVASLFTIRAVLPDVDRTDARPTIVSRTGESLITIFPGKIDTAVAAAEHVVAEIRRHAPREAAGLPAMNIGADAAAAVMPPP
jgi:glycine/D-amino acid oxidase-like deaminating enzyme